ncbi:Tetratricopeptide-like helical domain containing protein [Parasponia andersonii]|uniref:Tetratricopeptide-like helical domain containing protein n=1 Tax=Parasponia andersonii TaxID=3476 RepID=A0A2P5D4I0_PARAD|nr:Tetratricopeptide-like helical domain containing protein [Parasponia andersonii]
MPSSASSSPLPLEHPSPTQYLQTLLESARPFLRGELESVDERLPSLVRVLRSVGAGECWHKHGSFLDHLLDMYRILKLWRAQDSVCLLGLFHSAYSNSYVNLAIFDPSTGRDVVSRHVGEAAERLIHLFCIVPRQPLIHDDLLFHYSDSELIEHLKSSEISVKNAKERGLFDEEEAWRKKVRSLVPANGIVVKHIKTGEDVVVSRRLLAVFLLMTMADFSDQLFSFQDCLFENFDGKLEFKGNDVVAGLWPGDGKPGLWMSSISRMGALYSLLVREEEIFGEERKRVGGEKVDEDRDEDLELVIPPVFENCTRVLDAGEQIKARDLYWEAVCDMSKRGLEGAEELLLSSIEKNPFVGEPHVVLGQLYLSKGRFEEGEREAEKGLTLILQWGSPWDKRMSWEGWIAWARVLLMKATERSWPQTAWGILNLGLVRPSSNSSSSFSLQPSSTEYLKTLLDSARPFLRDELEPVDERLPSLVVVLHSIGTGECNLKHGTFLDHLINVDKEKGLFAEEEGWRKKLRSLVPANGIVVKHIKTGEDVVVLRRLVSFICPKRDSKRLKERLRKGLPLSCSGESLGHEDELGRMDCLGKNLAYESKGKVLASNFLGDSQSELRRVE